MYTVADARATGHIRRGPYIRYINIGIMVEAFSQAGNSATTVRIDAEPSKIYQGSWISLIVTMDGCENNDDLPEMVLFSSL